MELNNNIESPFSIFELGDEVFADLPCLSPCIDSPVPQFPSISPLENNNSAVCVSTRKSKNGRQRSKPPLNSTCNDINNIDDESLNEQKKKKILHRDVERQRRQEMSSLYTTLRSLLPAEYLKGKRSICDHMHEAVKYIQHMQSKIQQLSDKRDELKILYQQNLAAAATVETLNSSRSDSVVVRAKDGSRGIQVVLDTALHHSHPISNILQALALEGLEILSCISTKVNDRFIHTIEAQPLVNAGDYPTIDVSDLQRKLTNLEYFPFD